MGQKKFWFVSMVVVLIMAVFNAALLAAEPEEEQGWEFIIVPYLWGPLLWTAMSRSRDNHRTWICHSGTLRVN